MGNGDAKCFQTSMEGLGVMVLQKISDEIMEGPYDRNLLRSLYAISLRKRLRDADTRDVCTELPPELAPILPKIFCSDPAQLRNFKRTVHETGVAHSLAKRKCVENNYRTSEDGFA